MTRREQKEKFLAIVAALKTADELGDRFSIEIHAAALDQLIAAARQIRLLADRPRWQRPFNPNARQ